MRGGTSKGGYFLASDLPADQAVRDRVLLAAMGSPDARQIDGLGGAHPLTSKVAVVSRSLRDDADVDYLFLQVAVDRPLVDDGQNCGNILAGVGPFAIEQGLVAARGSMTDVRIHMVNSGDLAVAHVCTDGGRVCYEGDARIDGVPGSAAPVVLDFVDLAGSTCGALLPTGNASDLIDGIAVTLIDNGMPVIVVRAGDLGVDASDAPDALSADAALRARVEAIRRQAGPRMNLGDVADKTTPKVTLIAPPARGGTVLTRSFIPHLVHDAIGVFGAVSVATACVLPGTVAEGIARLPRIDAEMSLDVEHPTGRFTVRLGLAGAGADVRVARAGLLRTARKIFAGQVFVPDALWPGDR
jgi:4-oxalomesaconate tautomerase